jgi:RNA polymerase sigma factor (sigma-70 family)
MVSAASNIEDICLQRGEGRDEAAFRELIEAHRADLHAHCYRMLGSLHDADDALQDTLLRAWRALPRFGGHSSLRTWVHRIATNVCLDALARRPKLLVIPLVNVVLAAVPSEAAGGAGGQFSTAQQLGGALGVAVVGTVFFSGLDGQSFTDSFTHALPLVVGLFLVASVLALALPRTAAAEEEAEAPLERVSDAEQRASDPRKHRPWR